MSLITSLMTKIITNQTVEITPADIIIIKIFLIIELFSYQPNIWYSAKRHSSVHIITENQKIIFFIIYFFIC